MSIPIQNIYFLLSYAWNKLEEAERVKVDVRDITNLPSLFAKVLVNATSILLKRCLEQDYIAHQCEIAGIKGKFSLSETVKKNLIHKQKTICLFDDYSVNILSNQILITTLHNLLKLNELDTGLKRDVKATIRRLPVISPIKLNLRIFKQVTLHRNNQIYGFIINICQILYENLLPSENEGELTFVDFTRDERKMAYLFENFVRNFYCKEQNQYSVGSKKISWQLIGDSQDYLPSMYTDITLDNPMKRIIIDTKFYQQTLAKHYAKEKVHSHNIYQLFSYLINQRSNTDHQKTHTTTGILLYPTIDAEYNFSYQFEQHPIYIRTIDLNTDSSKIAERLLRIIEN